MSSAEKVRASHLLVKHQGSRRLASWKDPDGKVIRKTSRDDAVAKLRDFKTQIESGQATLADLAKNDSDCSSAKKGGDLGTLLLSAYLSITSFGIWLLLTECLLHT